MYEEYKESDSPERMSDARFALMCACQAYSHDGASGQTVGYHVTETADTMMRWLQRVEKK